MQPETRVKSWTRGRTGEPYEIMLELQVAAQQTSSWHTITNANTPMSSMNVAEVQAYN